MSLSFEVILLLEVDISLKPFYVYFSSLVDFFSLISIGWRVLCILYTQKMDFLVFAKLVIFLNVTYMYIFCAIILFSRLVVNKTVIYTDLIKYGFYF